MSIIRTLDHGKILNFIPANEGTGTTVESEAGANITDAVVTWGTSNAVTIGNLGSDIALDSGAFSGITAGTDWALMLVLNITTDGFLGVCTIGQSSGNNISLTGGSFLTVDGAAGQVTFGVEPVGASGVAKRYLVTVDADGDASVYSSAMGSDLSTTPDGSEAASGMGDITSIGSFVSFARAGGTTIAFDLYGFQMVEFTNGLPSDIVAQANTLMTQWEAGNKTHYPLYADEA